MNKKLFILGSINIDLSISSDRFPQIGETINGFNFIQSLGGKGLNQAYYSSKLGLATTLMSSIGNDEFQTYVENGLNSTNIIPKLQIQQDEQTGKAMIIKSQKDNVIILEHGANWIHNIDEIKKQISTSYSSYFLTQLEIPFNIAFESLKFAKSQEITTFLNATPAEVDDEKIYQYVDYLFVNETEAELLTEIKIVDENSLELASNYFLNKGVKHVVITLGSKGSYYQSSKSKHFQESIDVDVVSTVGAGDSFIGAFVYGLSINRTIKQSLWLATNISSQVCQSDSLHLQTLNI